MSDETAVATAPAEHHDHHLEHSHGLSDKKYVFVAIWLAVITACEVAWSYLPAFKDATGGTHVLEVGGLLVMMAIKFAVVALFFMHLKFDSPLLTKIFYSGLFLAVGVYVAVLFTFGIFL